MLIIGYARVSTADQNLDLQLDALRKAGCNKIFEDVVSGSTSKRPGLDAALGKLRDGDKLVVWRLDRLGRSLPHLIQVVTDIKTRNCQFSSLCENLDSASATGELLFHLLGALSQFERALLIERTQAGLEAAKRRGQKLGRRRKLSIQKVEHARQAILDGTHSIAQMAKILSVDRSTLWRSLRR